MILLVGIELRPLCEVHKEALYDDGQELRR